MRLLFSFCFALVMLASCRTQKQVTYNYLQNARDTTLQDSVLFKQPLIQKGDLLSIRVYSIANGIDPRVDAAYNLVEQGAGSGSGGSGGGVTGFQVDESGNIEYPQIGLVHAEGLTREQLSEEIKKKLEGTLNQPSVVVRFINFRVTVLGEVGKPGTFTAPSERINLLEAIGYAGDITEFGQKNTVRVIREINGQRQIGTIDLTSRDMFNSQYFRLQQNDIVMVDQSRRKARQQERQELGQQIGIASSIITAIALVLNLIK